jgi:hypothetical protein
VKASAVTPPTNGTPDKAKKVTATVAFSHDNPPPVLIVDSVRAGRKAVIEAEVKAGTFAPAVGLHLSKRWCDPAAVELSIINNEDNSAFEDAIATLKMAHKSSPLAASGRSTGGLPDGEIELSQVNDDSFMKFCEEQAEQAKKR